MALYQEKVELVKESLLEMLQVAEYSIAYKKAESEKWGSSAKGILGYPAAVLLFSIIDCMGSVFVGDTNMSISIDGNHHSIKNTSQHIFILNSKYFKLGLSKKDLNNIYSNFRSTLTHNSLMPKGYTLQVGEGERRPFKIAINEFDNRIYSLNLIPLLEVTKKAVINFMDDLDKGIIDFEETKLHKNIGKRDLKTMYYNTEHLGLVQRIKRWIIE